MSLDDFEELDYYLIPLFEEKSLDPEINGASMQEIQERNDYKYDIVDQYLGNHTYSTDSAYQSSRLMVSQNHETFTQHTTKNQMDDLQKLPNLAKCASVDIQAYRSVQDQKEKKCKQEELFEPQKKTKKISKKSKKSQDQKPEKPGYPTKNFLVQFKKVQLEEIENAFGPQIFNKQKWLLDIRKKNGINMKDYQQIYKVAKFQDLFASMFARNVLYRTLMTSRCNPVQKKYYISRIFRFQEAFNNKKFERIN